MILIPLYALADRFAGGWPSCPLPGRAVFWAALVLAGAGWLLEGPFGALAALAWFIWRTPAWGVFGGSLAARSLSEALGTFARHLIAAPGLALAAYWTDLDVLNAALLGGMFATFATCLSVWHGQEVEAAEDRGEPIGEQNTYIELARGAGFGVVVALLAWGG